MNKNDPLYAEEMAKKDPYGIYGGFSTPSAFGRSSRSAPQGYQETAEGYLARAAADYKRMGLPSGQMSNIGQQLMSEYQGLTLPTMKAATAAAYYRPDLVSKAAIDTQIAYDTARGRMMRDMARMGIDPNSGRFAGLQQAWALAEAAAKAGAKTRARGAEREAEFSRLMQAAQLGAGLPGAALSSLSQAAGTTGAGAGGLLGVAGEYGSLAAAQKRAEINRNAQDWIERMFGGRSSERESSAARTGLSSFNPFG